MELGLGSVRLRVLGGLGAELGRHVSDRVMGAMVSGSHRPIADRGGGDGGPRAGARVGLWG